MSNKGIPRFGSTSFMSATTIGAFLLALIGVWPGTAGSQTAPFHLLEATIEDIHWTARSAVLLAGPGPALLRTVRPLRLDRKGRVDPSARRMEFHRGNEADSDAYHARTLSAH